MWWAAQNIRTSTYIAIGIPKMPSMAKQSKISHGKLFRILLSICSWLKLCFVISQAYRTRPRTIKSMTCRIPYSVKCTSNEFITCFSRILNLRIHNTILQHFTYNEIQWPTAASRWQFALRDVSRRQSCHLLTPNFPRVPPVWPYCRQAQCVRWRSLK